MPGKLALWVYGDGKSPWLRATLLDGEGSRKTVNLTEGNIDWIGWKYVDVDIDKCWKLQLTLEKIYAVEIDKTILRHTVNLDAIFLDNFQFDYHYVVFLHGYDF